MKKTGLLLLLFILLPYQAFCSDSLTVDFWSSFNRDSVTLWVNGSMVYQGRLTTDLVVGLAESVRVPKTTAKQYEIVVASGRSTSMFRMKRKWKYLGIGFDKGSNRFTFQLSRKPFRYL